MPSTETTSSIFTTSLPDLLRIERRLVHDERGFFHEVVRLNELSQTLGREFRVAQVNHSRSVKGVLRGLHAEPWDKIVWVARGEAFSAIVDIRPASPTFGQYEIFELTEQNGLALYIPEGCANSVYARSDIDYVYQVNKTYDGTPTKAIAWNDPDIAVPWPNFDPIISQRDRESLRLREAFPEKFGD